MFPEVLYELFRDMPRQGPGSNEYTRRAYEYLPNLPKQPRILDIGCGSGMQTLELARISGGQVIALDNYQPFLDALVESAKTEGMDRRIKTVNSSVFELPFAKSTFDIIWSEGAIYIIGFEKGLCEWKPFIKPGGYLVVSELAWITPDRPDEIRCYMECEYPAIKRNEENKEIIRRAGYQMIDSFILSEAVWRDGFYKPYQSRLNSLKVKYAGNSEASEVLEACQREIDMYKKYFCYYSYVFYLMQLL
jgi:ubiquinone/menaquinone biosynthesis C-methylase UbiE